MPSPFPGMDPYLEHPAHYPDFHATFITYWREAVAAVLPKHYSARVGERVYLVEGPPLARRLVGPDVAVERTPGPPAPTAPTAAVTGLTPVTLPLEILDEVRETYIEILHRPDRRLVAVLELLSPANKEEPGRGEYLAKRNALLRQDVHLLELDLLRGGRRLPLKAELPRGDYYAFVSRGDRRPDSDVYHWPLADPLPPVPVPLRTPDADGWSLRPCSQRCTSAPGTPTKSTTGSHRRGR
jgi:hypothetical protein